MNIEAFINREECELLLNSLRQADVANTEIQKGITQCIMNFRQRPDCVYYFSYILGYCTAENFEIRQRAGLLLKAEITDTNNHKFTENDINFVSCSAIKASQDSSKDVRDTASLILYLIIKNYPKLSKPILDHISYLLSATFKQTPTGQEPIDQSVQARVNVLNWLYPIIQNIVDNLECISVEILDFCMNDLLQPLFCYSVYQDIEIRISALACLNEFHRGELFTGYGHFKKYLDYYWESLMKCLDRHELTYQVLTGIFHTAQFQALILSGFMEKFQLFSYFLKCLQVDQPYEIKLRCVDILLTCFKHSEIHKFFRDHLSGLLPLLVKNTRYSTCDYMQMDASLLTDETNAGVPDKTEDMEPLYKKKKSDEKDIASYDDATDVGDDEDFDDVNEFDQSFTWGSNFTLRKASALLLDRISSVFKSEILVYVIPIIEAGLQDTSPDGWENQESALLSLGAIARNCIEGLNPFLPKIIELIISLCDHKKPALRSISLWALSRFSLWTCLHADKFQAVCRTILQHFLDKNKLVQQAACSAFACFEEDAGLLLVPYLSSVYEAINFIALVDTISGLVEFLGEKANTPEFHMNVITPLLSKLSNCNLNNPILMAIFQCLGSVVAAIKNGFDNYICLIMECFTKFIYEAVNYVRESVAVKMDLSNDLTHSQNCENLEMCFDLVSSICEIEHSTLESCLVSNNILPQIVEFLKLSDSHWKNNVYQDLFALVGDLAKATPNVVREYQEPLLKYISPNISKESNTLAQNASWAIGQIIQYASNPEQVSHCATYLCENLSKSLVSHNYDHLQRNCCITLSRLFVICPAQCISTFEKIFSVWCQVMTDTPNDLDKSVAILSLIKVISYRQSLALENLTVLLNLIASVYETYGTTPTKPSQPPEHVVPEVHCVFVELFTWLISEHYVTLVNAFNQLSVNNQNVLKLYHESLM